MLLQKLEYVLDKSWCILLMGDMLAGTMSYNISSDGTDHTAGVVK